MNEANHFTLSGQHVHIGYFATSITGEPLFHYQDAQQSRDFKGDAVRRVETELGALISVTTMITVDSGSTTFTVLIPKVNVDNSPVSVHTEGIRTMHRFSLIPALMKGQLTTYAVISLHGTAEFVVA